MINQLKKKALIEYIKQRQKSNSRELLLSPGLYFDGYDDDHCTICANNSDPVSTSSFAARLQQIQERPDVSAVLVRFYEYSDAEDSKDCWISSDSIYVVTNAGVEEVRDWFSDFEVSDVWLEPVPANFDG